MTLHSPQHFPQLRLFLEFHAAGSSARADDMLATPGLAQRLLDNAVSSLSMEALSLLEPVLTPAMMNPYRGSWLTATMMTVGMGERRSALETPADRALGAQRLADFLARLIDLGASTGKLKGQRNSPLGAALYQDPIVAHTLMAKGATPLPDDLRLAIHLGQSEMLGEMMGRRAMSSKLLDHLAELARSLAPGSAGSGDDCLSRIQAFKAERERSALAKSVGVQRMAPTRSAPRI